MLTAVRGVRTKDQSQTMVRTAREKIAIAIHELLLVPKSPVNMLAG
jgi:hypothetical protein